jgi:hypothetical protein
MLEHRFDTPEATAGENRLLQALRRSLGRTGAEADGRCNR